MTNNKLVDHLVSSDVLTTPSIIEAFRKIDRKDFVPGEHADNAYVDCPLPIGHGQTISQPTTVAFMFELLDPKVGNRILDIGTGSGWTTALLAEIVGENGEVVGKERIPELVKFGQNNLSKYDFNYANIFEADSETAGLFDKILVSASANEIPKEYIDRLKVGGTMVVPVKNSIYRVIKVSKDEIKKEEYPGFVFVPYIV